MRVVALMPVKNEDWILDYTLTCLRNFVDEIVVLEDGSTDRTPDILSKHQVTVIDKPLDGFGSKRKELLRVGREHRGTHFVFLDADEAFTADLRKDFRDLLKGMTAGHKILLRWLAMWKSPFFYRDDESVWSNSFKDFMFCDDGISDFDETWIHEPRTPGENKPSNTTKIEAYGGVMHYQFVPWERFQAKQRWYRYLELTRNPHSVREIIETYKITEDDPCAKVSPVKTAWIQGYSVPKRLEDAKPDQYLAEIKRMENEYGKMFFLQLNLDRHFHKYVFVSTRRIRRLFRGRLRHSARH